MVVVVRVGDVVSTGDSLRHYYLRGESVREVSKGVFTAAAEGQSFLQEERPPCGGPEEVYASARIVVLPGEGTGETVTVEAKPVRGGTTTIVPNADGIVGPQVACG